MRFVFVDRAFAGAAAEHLLKQNAGFYRPQEDDVFKIGNVYTGRKHVHGDDDGRLRPVAEFANALQRPVDGRTTGDFRHERVAAAEDIPSGIYQLVGMRRMGKIIGREDESLREAAIALFMLQSVVLDFFNLTYARNLMAC